MNTMNQSGFRRFTALAVMALLITACGKPEQATPTAEDPTASVAVPVTTSSEAALGLFQKGVTLFDNLHVVEANEAFVEATALDPDFALAHYMVALTSQTTAEFFDAIGKARALAPNVSEGEQLYIRATVAASENDQQAQLDALKQLVAAYPQDARTHLALGTFLTGQQDFDGAVKHYMHATSIDPDFASAYNQLGYAHRSLGDLESAKSAFARYVELMPGEANPYDSYAELLMEMGSYDESIENYRKALSIDPDFAASYAGLTINYSLKGEADNAQEAAEQMLAAARNFAERQGAMFRSVTSYLFAGNTEAAMEVSETMLAEAEVRGNHAAMGGVHEYMGDMMLAADNPAKAVEHFNAALDHRLQANMNEANKAQAERTHLFKTTIAAMIGDDLDAAASGTAEYTAAVEANGTAFEKRRAHQLAAYLAMLNEEFESAAGHFAMASPFNPVVLYWSAVNSAELGDTEKARELATRAANRNTLNANLPLVRADALQLLTELDAD
ncbi:tetratricopeptide repeat protein [Gammaproteobacteria bacterium]|nr:tetratricopeptide repeat protein [Gammaproteobacteria bacterium]